MTIGLNDRVVSLVDTHCIDRGDPGFITEIRHRRAPLATEYTVEFDGHIRRMTANQIGAIPDNVAYPSACMPVRVRFNLDGAHLAMILLLARLSDDDVPTVLNHDDATRIITEALRDAGLEIFYTFPELVPSDIRRELRWAADQIRRLYPQLDDPELADLLNDFGAESWEGA